MTNTPSERDGEPLGQPIIDEIHLFTPAVPFKRGLGRGFMISASNAGPLKGTKMHAALEDYIQAEGPLKPGAYHYSAASGRWTKAPKSEDLEGISHISFSAEVPDYYPPSYRSVEDYVSETIRRKIADSGEAPTNEHSDLRAYREGAATYTPSKETPVSDDTNTKTPTDEQPIADRSPADDPNQIHVSKLIRTAGKKPTTLLFRIEVDPVAVSDDGRPCYQVTTPPTTTRVSQSPPRNLREADVAEYLTAQHRYVDLAHEEISKRAELARKRLDGIREELEVSAANMRGLYQVREEFLTQLADREEREAAAQSRPAEPPRARSVWRPTMVTFMKHQLDGDELKRVRYTAVREIDENSWAIAGQRDRFTWDELLDWIQFEEDDLDAVMNQVRYQHLMDKVSYRAARNDVIPGFGWIEESR